MKAQALRDSTSSSYMISKKTMEINPDNKIIQELKRKSEAQQTDRTVKDLIWLIFETAMLTSGFSLDDPSNFSTKIHRIIKLCLSINDDAMDEEVPKLEATNTTSTTGQNNMESVD